MAFQNAHHIDAHSSTFNDFSVNYHGVTSEVNHISDRLKRLDPAKMDPSRRTPCLENTRTDVLKSIFDWVSDGTSMQNMLWLQGLAGSGKSTISTTIANHFRERNQLGAFLFFDRDVIERSDPTLVIRTLAYQLGSFHPRIGESISAAVDSTPSILLSPLAFQFQKLIVGPVSSALPPSQISHIVVVLDALDECGTVEDREVLLHVLENFSHLPSTFRTILTSRAEADIQYTFHSQSYIYPLELDITSTITGQDILLYFRHRMALILTKKKYLGIDWPGENNIHALARRASGLFVWAATASRFIDGHDPRKRLDIVLQRSTTPGAESALDALYRTALESVGEWEDEDFVADFQAILGMVLVLRTPLSSTAIDFLLSSLDGRPSISTVSHLGCVVSSSPTVRIIHPSFADFLSVRSRCGRDIWFFQQISHNRTLAVNCFQRLDNVLRQNICNMTLSADLNNESLPEDIAYACMFWAEHVCLCKDNTPSITEHLDAFLNQHLLHWLEAMSILRRARDTVAMLNSLLDWINTNCPDHTSLVELVRDAIRFSRKFGEIIEEHPLLVYHSALPFAPVTSAIYQRFHDINCFPSISGGYEQSWSPALLILAGHQGWVTSAEFSPDRTRIVSGSIDKSIRVWDAFSGAQVLPALEGHEDSVYSVAFSPNSARIVSSSGDKTIRVWDAKTGIEVLPPLRGHKDAVRGVAFSPDGTRIVSGSDDTTIQVWDASSGTELLQPLRGHKDWIWSIAFSRDGTRILSDSRDKTIRVWDSQSGAILNVLQAHGDVFVSSAAFSPDGTRIVSASGGSIQVWDAISGDKVLPPLRGHTNYICSAAFSPDGMRIVSGSGDKTIRVWDALSGAEISPPMRGHEEDVNCVAFSPDGTRIVSGSVDRSIRVWDALSGTNLLPPRPVHKSWVTSLVFSVDGARIVSHCNIDNTGYKVWDATSGLPLSLNAESISTIRKEGQNASPHTIEVTGNGWIVDVLSNRTISKLPSMITKISFATHERSLVVGTRGGQVIIINFPPAVFTSSETRLAEKGSRLQID